MIINASQAPDLSLVQNSDRSAPAKAPDAGIDFAALLFLVLGVPQIPNPAAEGDPQALTNLNGSTGSVVGNAPGQVIGDELPFDPAAVQPPPTQAQNQGNDDGIISTLQQSLAAVVLPAMNGIEPVVDNVVLSPASSLTPSVETPANVTSNAASLVTPSLIPGEPQIVFQDGPTQANSEGFGQLVAQVRDAQYQQANANIVQSAEDPSGPAIGQGLSTGVTLNSKKLPDPNGTSIVVPDGDPVARPNEGSIINSDNRPAVEQSYKATVTNGTQPADLNSSSKAANAAAQDIHSPKRTEVAPAVENSTNTAHSTVTATAAGSKDAAAQEQNPNFRFDSHGEKTSHENVGTSHDPYSRLSSAPAVLSANGTAGTQELGTSDAKPAGNLSPVIEQVANNIAANVSQNRHEAVITLNPPELGSLKINLSLDGGKLQVHIIAEAHESRTLIENHLSELKQALQVYRLDLTDVRVDTGHWTGTTTSDLMQSFQRGPNGQEQPGWHPGHSWTPTNDAPESATADVPVRGRVSMWA